MFGTRLLRATLLLLFATNSVGAATADTEKGQRARLGRAQIPFVENCGQLDDTVAFSAPTLSATVFVTRDGKLVYSLPPGPASAGWTLTETLVAGHPFPTAGPRAATSVSYFRGNDPERWQNELATYDEVRLGQVWPGISVSLRAHGGNVEKLFTILPGSPAGRIQLRIDGARSLSIARDGALVAATGNGDVRFTAPGAYQESHGVRLPVAVAYVLDGPRYGFRLGHHDPTLPVVVDPLLQSTYLGGGSNSEGISAIAVHPSTGEIYVAGGTGSTDFPGVAGGAQTTMTGIADFFAARFDATLTTLLQATYLGGSGQQGVGALAIDPVSGDVFVGGFTLSTDFPGTAGGAQTFNAGGGEDGWVARLNPELTTLIQATYIGGTGEDFVNAIAIHPMSGEILVAGNTFSPKLPGAPGGAQPGFGGGSNDGFVTRLDPTLTTFLKTTYLGGVDDDRIWGIAIHPTSGEVLVAGYTNGYDLPGTAGGAQTEPNAGFVARFDATLTTLLQASYLGGGALGVAIHPASGEVLVTGYAENADVHHATGGAQPAAGGRGDAYVARLNPTLTSVLQATYLGGSGFDFPYAIALLPSGDVLVTGQTDSTDFPGTAGGLQSVNVLGNRGEGSMGFPSDAFVARLNPALTALIQSTYLGGNGDDSIRVMAVHPSSGEILVAGDTTSDDFPGRSGGAQAVYAGGGSIAPFEGFVTRLSADLAGGPCVAGAEALCLNGGRFKVQLSWRNPSKGRSGEGIARSLAADTGAFSFLDPSNVEVVVKVLDARTVNGHFWVFYGALSNLEYTITVTDMETGFFKTYFNPSGTLASAADTTAFTQSGGAAAVASTEELEARAGEGLYAMFEALSTGLPSSARTPAGTSTGCTAGGATLCLNQSRFQVTVDWEVPSQGKSGHATALPVEGGDTGYFWFLNPNNVELIVKVLDGRPVNGHFWFFSGALSSVKYTITVTDTETGDSQIFENPDHILASKAYTGIF